MEPTEPGNWIIQNSKGEKITVYVFRHPNGSLWFGFPNSTGAQPIELVINAIGYRWLGRADRPYGVCPDCNGSGRYVGILVSENCKRCGGIGSAL